MRTIYFLIISIISDLQGRENSYKYADITAKNFNDIYHRVKKTGAKQKRIDKFYKKLNKHENIGVFYLETSNYQFLFYTAKKCLFGITTYKFLGIFKYKIK